MISCWLSPTAITPAQVPPARRPPLHRNRPNDTHSAHNSQKVQVIMKHLLCNMFTMFGTTQLAISQSIKTHLYSTICRERIRGA